MGWRGILGLLVLVGGMAGYLWFSGPNGAGDNGEGTKPPPSTLTTKLLLTNIWAAREVVLRPGPNREPIILALDAESGRFLITDPVRDVASYAMLTSIFRIYNSVELLEGFSADEIAADPSRVAKVGLDQPRAEVEVRYADQTVTIAIGNAGFKENEIYVRVGDAIKRAPTTLFTAIQHLPDDLREKVLFTDMGIGNPSRVRLDRKLAGGRRVDAIERGPRGRFRVTAPKILRADQHMVDGLIKEIGSLRIERFLGGAAAQGFDAPADLDLVLEVIGDRGTDVLEIATLPANPGQMKGVVVGRLRERNVVFQLRGYGLGRLLRWAGLLRAKHLLALTAPQIQRLELDAGVGSQPIVLVRAATEGFRLLRPLKTEVRASAVGEALDALLRLEAQKFVDDPPADAGLGDDDQFFTVRVSTQVSVGRGHEIRIGRAAGDGMVYARRADEDSVVLLAAKAIEPLRRPWLDFVSLRVVPKEQVPPFGLEVWSPGKDAPVYYFKKDGTWRQEGSTDEADEVRELVEDELFGLIARQVFVRSAIPAKQQPVRVKLLREPSRNTDVLLELALYPHGKGVLVGVVGRSDELVYLVGQLVYRHLYDVWK